MTTTLTDAQAAQVAKIQLQIDALNEAIGEGATRVSVEGKSVDYDDFQSMKMRVNYLVAQIAQIQNSGARKPQAGLVAFRNPYQYRPYGYYGFRNF